MRSKLYIAQEVQEPEYKKRRKNKTITGKLQNENVIVSVFNKPDREP